MKKFNLTDRRILADLLEERRTFRDLAKVLAKSISSISDELRRNSRHGKYDPDQAHRLAKTREKERRRRGKLEINEGLKNHVIQRLREDWSPDEIAQDLKKQRGSSVITHETIYRFIYSREGRTLKLWQGLRHKKTPRRQARGQRTARVRIPGRVPIALRPAIIATREELGHWEGDLMIFSRPTRSVLAVFVERKTRLTVAVALPDKTADSMAMAMHELISRAGQTKVKSITLDNGSENVCHVQIREDYVNLQTYFCDPYCSWQKGTVENTNKLLRQYFPRRIPPEQINQDYVDTITEKLNRRPRTCLQYSTPLQTFNSCSD